MAITALLILSGCATSLPQVTTSAVAEPATSLGIYVVRGDAAQLKRFHSEIGEGWLGGEFLERLSTNIEYRYWAYPTRAARDARTFMFGSIDHQLRFDIEEYDEATSYPSERALLNEIVSRCRLKSDPFFVEPDRTLVVKPHAGGDCVTSQLKRTFVDDGMPIEFLSKPPSDRD